MTAKEKAIDLVNKFREFANGNDEWTDRFSPAIEKENAKLCAIIAVDEVIGYGYKPEFPYKYWEEVKQEIEKL